MSSSIEWVIESTKVRKELASAYERMMLFDGLLRGSLDGTGIRGWPGQTNVWHDMMMAEREYIEYLSGSIMLLKKHMEKKHELPNG